VTGQEIKLNLDNLSRLPSLKGRMHPPAYSPAEVTIGHLHIGLGSFFRAHQAVFSDDILARDRRWGISAANLHTHDLVDRLRRQDGLYTVKETDPQAVRLRIIGSVRETLAPADGKQILARLASASTKVVTLTVTEKGYRHDAAAARDGARFFGWKGVQESQGSAAGSALRASASAANDLPESMLGYLAVGLRQRSKSLSGAIANAKFNAAITLISCDNLSNNGDLLRERLLTMVAEDHELLHWLERHVTFPNTMVDRIVPAPTPPLIEQVAAEYGLYDEAPLITESFRCWVIEDRFANDRPPWEAAGAELVSQVKPFEELKLRVLNGSHSALAYFGLLAGVRTVSQAVRVPGLQTFVHLLTDQAALTLQLPGGYNLSKYEKDLMSRFQNPFLEHSLAQIATDGSQKIPQRWLAPALAILNQGHSADVYALALAGWMRAWQVIPEQIIDPLAQEIRAIVNVEECDDLTQVRRLFQLHSVFPASFREQLSFAARVADWLRRLKSMNVDSVLQSLHQCAPSS
jgi:fructuronate reductase